ncbi:MAG TPA: beta-phosphoglucomutase [Bellilinea sp.]|nr:beta-phosphoglucomutase [Bellilinea sp.]
MIKAFIFDLDGVITDTSEFHYLAWKRLADEEEIPFSRQKNEELRGVSRRDSLLLLLAGRQVSEGTLQLWMTRKNNYYLDLVRQITPKDVLPGVKMFLDEARGMGICCAIASSSKNANLVVRNLQIGNYFSVIVDGNAVEHSKPHPVLFLTAAEKLCVNPHECIVFEDAASGIEAAIAARMISIGIGPRERLSRANQVYPDFTGITPGFILSSINQAL